MLLSKADNLPKYTGIGSPVEPAPALTVIVFVTFGGVVYGGVWFVQALKLF